MGTVCVPISKSLKSNWIWEPQAPRIVLFSKTRGIKMSKRWLCGGSSFNRRGVELGNTGQVNCTLIAPPTRFKYTKIHAQWLDHQILVKLCWKYLRFPRPPIYIFKDYWIRIWPPPIQRFVSNMRGFRSVCCMVSNVISADSLLVWRVSDIVFWGEGSV